MKFVVQTPMTDTYVDDFIQNISEHDKIKYGIKNLTGDLTILKKVVRQKLRDAKSDMEMFSHSEVKYQLAKNTYDAYRLLDTLIKGAREIKE